MTRKGFTEVDQVRGLLSAPTDVDGPAHERLGYVGAMRDANSTVYGPW